MAKKINIVLIMFVVILTLFNGVFTEVKGVGINEISVSSTAFRNGDKIPLKYVCNRIPKGGNVSIPLAWTSAPQGTKSLAIYMYDLNPIAKNHIHWVVVNIPIRVTSLKEGLSRTQFMPAGSVELPNTTGLAGYEGPCPPVGTGNHQYKIVVLALNTEELKLSGATTLESLQASTKGKVLGRGELSGYYRQ